MADGVIKMGHKVSLEVDLETNVMMGDQYTFNDHIGNVARVHVTSITRKRDAIVVKGIVVNVKKAAQG